MSGKLLNTIRGAVIGALAMFVASDTQMVTLEVSNNTVSTRIVTDALVPKEGFASQVDAVTAASNRYNPDSVRLNREHVGGILNCAQDDFFYTHGVGDIGQAPVQFSIAIPKSCKFVSIWHTHGGRFEDREYFSPSDTQSADMTGKPMFMTNHTGKLHVYHPGGRKIWRRRSQRTMLPLPRGGAIGEIVKSETGSAVEIATR